jgi:uncharacterized membrane protein
MEFLVTAILVILLVRWFIVRGKFEEYDRRIAELTYRIWTIESARQVALPPPPPPNVVMETARLVTPPPPLPPPPPFEPVPEPETMPEPEPIYEPQPLLPKSGEWEAFIGGSLLNKLGALILVVGIALFLGYSFGHLSAAGRAAIAIALSVSLLGTGVFFERRGRYKMFSKGLIGAGWAALYATSYAVYALPEARIINDPFVGSLVMLMVAAAMVTHSLYYRSQAVTAGAFFTAFAALAVTPNSPFAVVSLIPLAAAVLYLASRFGWYWLPLFGLAATYLTCISRGQSDASLTSTQSLFLVYWLLFEGFDLIRTKRGIVANGLQLVSPINTLCFLGLSYVTWQKHDPDDLWLSAAIAAALYLADSLIRAYIRPAAENEDLPTRLKAGSYEAPLVISSALAALAIVGRVSGIWTAAALAIEAEVLYLAGIQLASPFIRGIGFAAFGFSLLNVVRTGITLDKSELFGHTIWAFSPAALFHAALFYVNRILRKPNFIFSSSAAILIAAVLAVELPEAWVGTAWVLFGALLFEFNDDFRQQSYFLLALGASVAFLLNLNHPSASLTPLGIILAVAYQAALRRLPTLQIGATATTGLISALLIYRLVPTPERGLAWMALGIIFLLHDRVLGLREFRVAGTGLAALALVSTLLHNIDPPTLTLSLAVVAGLYAAQLLMHLEKIDLEEIIFSIAATLLLSIVLYGRVSGSLLTVAWGCQGLALLAAGFPLGQRVLRLQGLALLGTCILKLFLYDLRNLETLYRILSFVALGAILLGVSWIYTRFQDQIKKLL